MLSVGQRGGTGTLCASRGLLQRQAELGSVPAGVGRWPQPSRFLHTSASGSLPSEFGANGILYAAQSAGF